MKQKYHEQTLGTLGRVIVYNPMSFVTFQRQAQCLKRFGHAAFVLLFGTKLRQVHRGQPLMICHKHKGWIAISAGYNQNGNRCAGVAIAINKNNVRLKSVRRIGYPSALSLQGIILFMRVIFGIHDLTVGAVYFPPQY